MTDTGQTAICPQALSSVRSLASDHSCDDAVPGVHTLEVQQAIFTSVRRNGRDGYQLVAASPGVSDPAQRELAIWGPSHDSLWDDDESASSVNFHSLSDGIISVSRTITAGNEYSGRGGWRVYTRSLLLTQEEFARFGSHPFRFLEAVETSGILKAVDPIPDELDPLRVVGRAGSIDVERLKSLLHRHDAEKVQRLLSNVIHGQPVGIIGADSSALIAGLLDLVPPSCRAELSFATGLKYSPRRPFRLFSCSANAAEQRRIGRHADAVFFDVDGCDDIQSLVPGAWAEWVDDQLLAEQYDRIAAAYADMAGDVHLRELNEWGARFRSGVSVTTSTESHAAPDSTHEHRTDGTTPTSTPAGVSSIRIPHEPHANRGQRQDDESAAPLDSSVYRDLLQLDLTSDAVLERLDDLDDAVIDAIRGDVVALDRLRSSWDNIRDSVDAELLDESRAQYLQYALTLWVGVTQGSSRTPEQAISAMDVLCVLFEEGSRL